MTKTQVKQRAQSVIMESAQRVFYAAENEGMNPEIIAELDKQFTRLEKLFGYVPGSWLRSC